MAEKNLTLTYDDLRQFLIDFYKNEKGLKIDIMNNYFFISDILSGNGIDPIFITSENIGSTRFTLSKDKIIEIIKYFYTSTFSEIIGDISFDKNGVSLGIIENPEVEVTENPLNNIIYSSSMGYEQFRDIVVEEYFKENGTRIIIDKKKFVSVLRDDTDLVISDIDNESIRITHNELIDTLRNYLLSKGFKPVNINFEEQILICMADKNSNRPDSFNVTYKHVDERNAINKDANKIPNKVPEADSDKPTDDGFGEDGLFFPTMPVYDKSTDLLTGYAEVDANNEIIKRKHYIRQVEQRKKKYAILAAIALTITIITTTDRVKAMDKTPIETFEQFETWDTTMDYIGELGPVPTVFGLQTAYYAYQYFKNRRKAIDMAKEQIEYCDKVDKVLTRHINKK